MENQLIRLRPDLGFTSSGSNGKLIAEDRVNQKFWRLGPIEYELCAYLEAPARFEDAAKLAMASSKTLSDAGPEKVTKTLLWLLQSGMLEVVQPEITQQSANDLSAKVPIKLFDPSCFRINLFDGETLDRLTKPLTWLLSYPLLLIAIVSWVVGGVFAYNNSSQLATLSTRIFVPGSQWWFLIAWVILKFVHELGHAIACSKVGIKPSSAGLGFIFFTPSPFVNATNIWKVESRWSRMLVSAAGMLFEATCASLAVICACLSASPSVQYLCISMVTLGTISTLAFNGNPLLRFDGYYIFIDLIGRPNLWQDANASLKKLAWSLVSKTKGRSEIAPLLQLYGITSLIYRLMTLTALAWGLWVAWDGIGLIVAIVFGCIWFVVPKLLRRGRATPKPGDSNSWIPWQDVSGKKVIRVGIAGLLLVGLGFLPSPFQVYWPGCVDFVDPIEIRAVSPGLVSHVLFHDGQGVRKGDEIMRLTNPDLELEALNAEIEYRACEERCNILRAQRKETELKAEEAARDASKFHFESLREKAQKLSIRSPRDGILMIRSSQNLVGVFLEEGHAIGLVVEPSRLEIRASAPADRWDILSRSAGNLTDVFLSNGERWKGELVQVLPRTTDRVEFPALAGMYGGPLTVKISTGDDGKDDHKSIDPRCHVRISLKPNSFQRTPWMPNYRPNLPSPGILCSVKLDKEKESIWQTVSRWINAALRVRFQSDPVPA